VSEESCIFCKIARREIPSTPVFEDEAVFAFRDVNPVAPTHILVVPKVHVSRLSELSGDSVPLLGRLLHTVARIAEKENLKSYRVNLNDGREAGQSVFHLHVHLLGGRPFSWPPG